MSWSPQTKQTASHEKPKGEDRSEEDEEELASFFNQLLYLFVGFSLSCYLPSYYFFFGSFKTLRKTPARRFRAVLVWGNN